MLAPLLEVVGLQVVDDGQVVDVATALRDVTMLIAVIDLSEFADELLCKDDKEWVKKLAFKRKDSCFNVILKTQIRLTFRPCCFHTCHRTRWLPCWFLTLILLKLDKFRYGSGLVSSLQKSWC